ncbi:MAG TPA: GNAT family N-acetyltransferase [Polyangiales bacterium]|jgi:ribosomal protein S18 acetylase RimI-like enzyme|nr:GNAT family N-acetyltransferase [Polyangiales bacterium]
MSIVLTRPAVDADRQFIVSGWSASYRSSHDIALVPSEWYADIYHRVINYHLDRVAVLVAHGETETLFGFIAFDPQTYVATINDRRVTLDGHVYYIYIAEPFRRRRIARRLLEAAGIAPDQRFGFACRTRWSWMLRAKTPNAEYDSFKSRYS